MRWIARSRVETCNRESHGEAVWSLRLALPKSSPGLLLLTAGCSCQANNHRNRMAASLGAGRSLDRSFCCGPGFTDSWSHNSAIRRTSRPSLKLRFSWSSASSDPSCSIPHHHLAAWIVVGLGMGAGLYDATPGRSIGIRQEVQSRRLHCSAGFRARSPTDHQMNSFQKLNRVVGSCAQRSGRYYVEKCCGGGSNY